MSNRILCLAAGTVILALAPGKGLAGLTPAAEFPMNEVSWTGPAPQVVDSTGNGHDGTAVGGANTVADSTFGRVGSFDGSGQYVTVGGSGSIAGTGPSLPGFMSPPITRQRSRASPSSAAARATLSTTSGSPARAVRITGSRSIGCTSTTHSSIPAPVPLPSCWGSGISLPTPTTVGQPSTSTSTGRPPDRSGVAFTTTTSVATSLPATPRPGARRRMVRWWA